MNQQIPTFQQVEQRIKASNNESDLFHARALLNKFNVLTEDRKEHARLKRMFENKSRQLARGNT